MSLGRWLIPDQVYLHPHIVEEGGQSLVAPGYYLLTYTRTAPGNPGRWRCSRETCRGLEDLKARLLESAARPT